MLVVGVATRLGMRPARVLRWPLEEVLLVAGYCALEAEQFKAPRATTTGARGPAGSKVVRETVRYVSGKKKE